MLFGPEKVLSCPHCAAPARVFTLRSGNTHGAVIWTDGKMSAPMLPQAPTITRCQACEQAYWVADAPMLGEMELDSTAAYPAEWTGAPAIEPLNETELLEALAAGLGDSQARERELRTLAWWAANDSRRPPAFDPGWESAAPLLPPAAANLERLIALVDPATPEGRLIQAEAARELGDFAAARTSLAPPFPERYQKTADDLRRLVEAGDTKVRLLSG